MSLCNCGDDCKIQSAIRLADVIATKRLVESDFNEFWATAKNQKQAMHIALGTDFFMIAVEKELKEAQINFNKAFNPFRAVKFQ